MAHELNRYPTGIRSTRTPGAAFALTIAGGLLLAGCAGGPTGQPPAVTDPANAADVTLYRSGSWVGFPALITLKIDGREVYRFAINDSYSIRLDPGEYILDFTIGFNLCRSAILVYPGHAYRYRLVPNCYLEREPIDTRPYGYDPQPGDDTRSYRAPTAQGIDDTSYGELYGL